MSSSKRNDINESQRLQSSDSVVIDSQQSCDPNVIIDSLSNIPSSFDFESGAVVSDEEQTVYFVLEPSYEATKSHSNDNSGETILPTSHHILSHAKANVNSVAVQHAISRTEIHPGNKIIPGRTRAGVTKCLESGCSFVCSRIPQLRNHLEEVHGILQERKLFAFDSEEDFKAWLSIVETEARCTFMRRRGWQVNKNGSTTACFYCHRGGAYTSRATKKQVKMQGSCKIGIECTSSMKVTIWTLPDTSEKNKGMPVKHVQVEAYLQHYGHNLDLNHIRITKEEKDNIARKLSCGISRNKILDDVRSTLDASDAPHRLHLLSLQDLYNIERKEGIRTGKRSSRDDEGTTVQAWIEKMQKCEENPVLLIKYQQEKAKEACACLSDDDFILILQTPLQAMMLRRYGPHQCVCIDITRGEPTNGNKNDPCFYLLAIEVIIPILNDREEVFPVAWFVCNRKDEAVIQIFLSQIKKNLSDLTLTPSYLLLPSLGITGGCDWFKIWTSIFGSGPRKLLGGWHILGEWKQRIHRAKVKTNAQEESRLVSNLQAVLQSANVDEFVRLLEQFLADLSRESATLALANFFKTTFAGQPEVWSRAYRSEAQVQTDLKFEEYHNKTVRHIYHEGFKRKQLDVLIKTLMRHSRDRALNKLRQSFKLTNDVSIRCKTSSNHADSCQLPLNFVSPQKNSHSWSVMSVIESVRAVERSADKEQPMILKKVAVEYVVSIADVDRCPARLMCAYRCAECEACSHHITCTCQTDQKYIVAGEGLPVLCEHCHLVVRFLRENDQKVESLFSPASSMSSEVAKVVDEAEQTADPNQVVVMVFEDEEAVLSVPVPLKEQEKSPNDAAASVSRSDDESTRTHAPDSDVIGNSQDPQSDDRSASNAAKPLVVERSAAGNVRRSGRKRNENYNCKEFLTVSSKRKKNKG